MDKSQNSEFDLKIPELLFALIRYELFRVPLDKETLSCFSEETLERIFALADRHDLAHWAGDALYQNNCLPKAFEITQRYQQAQVISLYRCTKLAHERAQITRVFEETGIPYVPLKGMIIKDFYPKPHLRTSSDTDILIHKEDLPHALACLSEQLKYTRHGEDCHFHDVSLFSPSGFHLELHFTLACDHAILDPTLEKVWDYCAPVKEGAFEHRQSPEYFMFHQIAHMASHFLNGGCGIRPLADLQLLHRQMTFDEAKVEELCREAHILTFYTHIKALSKVWFDGQAHDEVTRQMQSYILFGGVYGIMDNTLAVKNQKQSKTSYILSRIFMPYRHLKIKYPVLQRHKWLYPFMTVRRWFNFLPPARRKRATTELKKTTHLSDARISDVARLLEALDLNV